MYPAIEHALDTGEIAFERKSKKRRGRKVMFHLLRPGVPTEETKTMCGFYTFSRHTGDENIREVTPRCGKCFA